MNNSHFISQTKLDVLFERICRPIPHLSVRINPNESIWDEPIKLSQQIESDYFSVDSVIKNSRSYKGNVSGTNIYYSEILLCRVYILLYYLYHDEKLYKDIVFNRLLPNMGVYNNKYINNINSELDKLFEQEKLVEQIKADNKKNLKPVFAYVQHSGLESDHLYIEYNEELLFREMTDMIKSLVRKYDTKQDEADIWYNAKQVVHTLRDLNRPELLIERAAVGLVAGQFYNEYKGSQIILVCAYAMIRASEDNDHFAGFINKIEGLSDVDTDLTVIKEHIKDISEWVTENEPFDGYDYIGKPNIKNETYTSADIERLRKQIVDQEKEASAQQLMTIEKLKEQVKELSKEKAALEDKLKIFEEEQNDLQSFVEINWHDKVRLELLVRLMEKSGLDLQNVVKARVAEVMHSVTGLPLQTCKNYCTNRDLNTEKHKNEILQLNSKLQDIKINILL